MEKSIISQPIKVYALGGLGEVGKNTYCVESNNSILIIDAGVKFPNETLVGVDYVVPDYTQLKDNQSKIKALVITHGHEDHIGGIPFLIQTINVPVIYAPPLAAALIRNKLEEHRIRERVKIVEINETDILSVGEFKLSFFRVTHSIPDAFGIVVDTPAGRIVTTGDFKIDLTPVGPDINLRKIARLGEEGVDLLGANLELSAMEFNLVNAMSRETTLRTYLNDVKKYYDYILIDCMPSLGMVTLNALSAADSVIIPVQAQYLPARGMTQLLQTISRVKKYINPDLKIDGILLTLVDHRTNLAKSTIDALKENFTSHIRLYRTMIPIGVKAAETSSKGKSIYAYEPQSAVSKAYESFVKEVLADARKKERLSSKDVR